MSLAIGYPIAYLVIRSENAKHILFGVAFLITVASWILTDIFKGDASKGALFKEEFDVTLFRLPWKFLLSKPDIVDIISFSKRFKGDIKNWYSPTISETIPHYTAIAICQRVNSGWDIVLRRRYRRFLYGIISIHFLIVLTTCVVLSVDALTMFLLYFSLLSFYGHFLTLIRGNTGAIKKRQIIVSKLDHYINNKKEFQIDNLRDVQDEIYNIRQEPAKVPDTFFRLYNKKIKQQLEEYIQEINKRYTVVSDTAPVV